MNFKDHGIIALIISVLLAVGGALLHEDLKGAVCNAPAAAVAPVAHP